MGYEAEGSGVMNARVQARWMALVALAAVGVYAMSCKPAWSPDGAKVAYILARHNDDQGRYAVAVYDIATKQSETILECVQTGDEKGFAPYEVFWPRRGGEIVCLSILSKGDDDGRFQLSTYDLKSKTIKNVEYDEKNMKLRPSHPPEGSHGGLSQSVSPIILQRGRWLWLPNDDGCCRMDLKNKELRVLKQAQAVFGDETRLFYAARGADGGVVFGKIGTWFGLREKPLFTVPPIPDVEVYPILAAPGEALRFACLQRRTDSSILAAYDGKGVLVKEIPLPDSAKWDDDSAGGAAWKADGSALWIPTASVNKDNLEYTGIAEVRIADGAVRIIKVNEHQTYGALEPFQLSLSPDGEHLAASVVRTEHSDSDDLVGLCIVDVSGEERPVSLILPPEFAAPAAPKAP